MARKLLPVVLGVIVLAALLGWLRFSRPGTEGPRLHVLLITLDTTRADRLGCFGCEGQTSPNLDALARESVVFDRAIAQAAVTPVSHASILTGLEPYHHGLRVMHGRVGNRLRDGQTTLAEVWRTAGGRTAAFISAFPVASVFGLDQGFGHFDADFPGSDGETLISPDGVVNTEKSQRRADETTRAAVEWLRTHVDPDRPLFMWVHYFDPHDPFLVPPEDVLRSLLASRFPPASQERPDVLRAVYDCEVNFMDRWVGKLLDEFKVLGLWERTMVVVVADHGEGLGDHNWWSHGILYQEQIHVPLLVRVPGVPGGRRIGGLVRTIDLAPTILQVAGVRLDRWPEMDGESLADAIESGGLERPREAYSEAVSIVAYGRPDGTGHRDQKDDKHYCLIDGAHKLIFHQLNPSNTEFYNLQDDPGELHNLAGGSPPAMARLMQRLQELDPFSDIMPGMTETDLERAERLKSLGYIQ